MNRMAARTLTIIKYEPEGSRSDFHPCKNFHDLLGNMVINRVPITHNARNIVDIAEKIIIPSGEPIVFLFSRKQL
ncbi:hypothetical protein [Paenibacillus sp. FSL R10-2771]|uniref:hypothetical protein n=1 Tax=Paenibacillus sp. FSL R10-2771 TaxID=2954693 RepID=UPI0030F540E8